MVNQKTEVEGTAMCQSLICFMIYINRRTKNEEICCLESIIDILRDESGLVEK